jgi:hypothetical protein
VLRLHALLTSAGDVRWVINFTRWIPGGCFGSCLSPNSSVKGQFADWWWEHSYEMSNHKPPVCKLSLHWAIRDPQKKKREFKFRP